MNEDCRCHHGFPERDFWPVAAGIHIYEEPVIQPTDADLLKEFETVTTLLVRGTKHVESNTTRDYG